jgi:transposase
MAIALRGDFDAARLRRLARRSGEPDQVRRLLALATIYDGASRAEAAAVGGVTRQIVRDWVVRFNADGSDALLTRKAPGKVPLLDAAQRAALMQVVEDGPLPATDDVVRWRLVDLCQWVWERFAISVSRQTLGRELRALGYRKLSARPRHHAQAEGAVEAFKKAFRPRWQRSRARKDAIPAT